MKSPAQKIRKFRRLLSEGRYKEILRRVFFKVTSVKIIENAIYSHLHRKYSTFISAHVSENLPSSGAGHENIIWRLWLQGEDNEPELCKACLKSLRLWHPEKKIITLDANNISDYIALPEYIIRKHEKGIIPHAHFSDIIRAELLTKYGGTWIDSTVYCTGRNFEDVTRLPLFVFQMKSFTCIASNWLIASDADNPVITLTRDLLFDYWKNHDYPIHYFLFHMFFKMSAEAYPDEWQKVPYVSNGPPHEMQHFMYYDYSEERMKYFEGISDFHKLTYKFDSERLTPSSILQHVIDSYK